MPREHEPLCDLCGQPMRATIMPDQVFLECTACAYTDRIWKDNEYDMDDYEEWYEDDE